MIDPADAKTLSRSFWLLGHPLRLRVIDLLAESHPLCVAEMCKALDVKRNDLAAQLLVLRRARLVSSRQDGRPHYYRLTKRWLQQRGGPSSFLRSL